MDILAAQAVGPELGLMGAGLLIGGFTFFCALKDYDWFMNSRKAAFLTMILGRSIARIFYMVLGLAFIGGGLFLGISTLLGK